MSYWFGVWWITIWSSGNKEITVGIGKSLPATSNKVFHVQERRWKCFWIYTTMPTITFLNKGQRLAE